ncbi:MAG: hypothetical protein WB757_11610 [Candidatus Cybelea sp.]
MLASTLLIAALAGGAGFPAPGTYRYAAAMSGQHIGAWSVSVSQTGSGTEIDEDSTASMMGMQLSAKASLVLGLDLAPTSYAGNYHTPSQNPVVSATLTATSATVSGAFNPEPQQLALEANTRHFVVIEPGLLAGLFALPSQLNSWKDSAVTWITPATAQAQTLTTAAPASGTRPAGVPPNDAVISIVNPTPVTIWYDPSTNVPDEISVPSQNAVLTRQRP